MTTDPNFHRAQFKSSMVIVRHLAEVADPDFAQFMFDQLTETCRFLARRRTPVTTAFQNCVVKDNDYAIES